MKKPTVQVIGQGMDGQDFAGMTETTNRRNGGVGFELPAGDS